MSGNPHGLSEISHFGKFQSVGGKAGGFISKKFFHPSSFRNQEKLWQAQNKDEREARKQAEMEARRAEERAVEDLRKQMYLSGQGKASDFASASGAKDAMMRDLLPNEKKEQSEALAEQKRRMAQVKAGRAQRERSQAEGLEGDEGPEEEEEEEEEDDGKRKYAQSRYPEDVYVLGHKAVWGSWYSAEDKRWGFACCKELEREKQCPLEPEEPAEAQAKSKGSKRRRGGGAAAGGSASDSLPAEEGGLQKRGRGGGGGGEESKPLLDPKLLEAHARRMEKKRQDEERKQKEKERDRYLAGLVVDPSAEAEK